MRPVSIHLLAIAAALGAFVGCGQPELDGHGGLAVLLPDAAAGQPAAHDGGAGASMINPAGDAGTGGGEATLGDDAGANDAGVARDGAADASAAEAGSPDAAASAADAGAGLPGPDATSASHDAGGAAPTSYEAESGSLFGQATIVACAACSNGHEVSLKADSGFELWGVDAGGEGARSLIIHYANGTSGKTSLYVGVNGDDSQSFLFDFPPTGGWDQVSSVTVSLTGFRAGTNNMMTFFIDTEQPAADVDRIEFAASASASLAR